MTEATPAGRGVKGSALLASFLRALVAAFRRENPWRYVGRAYDPLHPHLRERTGYPHILPLARVKR